MEVRRWLASSAGHGTLLQSYYHMWGQQLMAVRLRVKEIAKAKGFSMGKLQRDADVAYNTVKRIFRDPYYVTTTETLGKLAKALGVSPGELIEEDAKDADEKYFER